MTQQLSITFQEDIDSLARELAEHDKKVDAFYAQDGPALLLQAARDVLAWLDDGAETICIPDSNYHYPRSLAFGRLDDAIEIIDKVTK